MSEEIRLLDCTLRDGGYINQWDFGKMAVHGLIQESCNAGSDVIELGFLRDVEYRDGTAVFSSMEQAEQLVKDTSDKNQYAVMCEALNPLPADKIEPYQGGKVHIIRVIVWKRLLDEGYEYCRKLVEKGYLLCVQPNRVEQYSDEEYRDMILRFNALHPLAFYVVDSFGILDTHDILRYADIADEYLDRSAALGYHGHNNLMQAYGTAQALIRKQYDRTLMLDASVYGIGRGAGNLNIELIAKYLNENCSKNYDAGAYWHMYERYIRKISEKEVWGYSPYYYLTALHRCNPMYAKFFEKKADILLEEIDRILEHLSEEDKIRYSEEKALEALQKYREGVK